MLPHDIIKRILDKEAAIHRIHLDTPLQPELYEDPRSVLDTSHIHPDWRMPTSQQIDYVQRQLARASSRTSLGYKHPTK